MTKPTLQEIAEMPFPASERVLQQHYGVEPLREKTPGGKGTWKVSVSFEVTVENDEVFTVEAESEEEAIELAEQECEEAHRRSIHIIDTIILARPA